MNRTTRYSPSDFPLARVSQSDLDKILMGVKTGEGRSAFSDLYPLTPLQQGLWFHALMDPASGMYIEQSVLRIEGFPNRDMFRRAWEKVVARHAVLRTRIIWEGLEHPLQLVQSTVELPWAEQDWRGSPVNEHQARLLNFLGADRARGFDLTQAPLMRLTLLQVTETSAILIWSFHHLILDRWSVDVVQQEVWSACQALVQGRPLQFNSLRPYRDYLGWLQDQDLNRAEQYWRHLLRGFTEPTVLGMDQAPSTRVGHQEGRYDSEELTLPEAATTALSRWARQQQLTVNTVVQGALAVLLSRYSGSEDVVFGTTVSGRSAGLPGIETMVGLFINTLPVRVQVSPGCSLAEWLRELQEQQMSLREYEYAPIFEIQKWSEVPPGAPLFNTLLLFENIPRDSNENLMARAAGLDVQRVAGRRDGETNYSLTVMVVPGRTLQLRFTYSTEHYTADVITRMVGHFQQVLAGMVEGTEQQLLGTIPLLKEAERQQLLVEWNATETAYPRDVCIHNLFEHQVSRTPHAVAVAFGEAQLTYQELNVRANQLAHYLQRHGVGPEVRVGLCVARSLEMVVGMLGILKAGGAYIPLDPGYPADRLAYMLADAQAPVLLTQAGVRTLLPAYAGHIVTLQWETLLLESSEPLPCLTRPENLAYVLYTSGSTGQPKGVMIAHESVVAFLHWARRAFSHQDLAGVLAATSICFDLSVFELFVPLSWGGTVVLVENALQLAELPGIDRVTLVNTVPSVIRALLDKVVPPALRTVNLAGEPLKTELVAAIYRDWGVGVVQDLYGPSEATTYATSAIRSKTGPAIIGQALGTTTVYLQDRAGQLVPVGVTGELYIGGPQVARGYLDRPALTAEKFVPHPFSNEPGERLYKTGDMVRYRPDGMLEFKGRRDHQVKVRGYRIELGEIEAVVTQHPAVAECVALVREDEPGQKRLVGYVVCSQGPAPTVLELRKFLETRMPGYMVPGTFVVLQAFPLTSNGKIDRKRLPIPEGGRGELESEFIAPQTPIQIELAEIWREVLKVEQVGVHDDFFELGGHSLLAMQMVSRIYQAFEVELPLSVFFEQPTVAGMADFLTKVTVAGEAVARPQLLPVSRKGRLPLSFTQESLWLLEQLDPGGTAYSMPAAFRLSGALNLSALEQSLFQLLQRHEILRTSYSAVADEQPVQVIASGKEFSLPVIDLETHSPDEQESAVRQQIQEQRNRPFDLAQGPLFRVSLLRLASEEYALLLVLHHSIADGLSMNILYREVATGYDAACHGETVKRPPLPVQYADYAVWQRQRLQGTALDSLLTYWTGQLAGAPPLLALPTDFPRPPIQTHRGADHFLQLPESLVSSLRALSQAEGVTMFMTLHAAFVLLLSRHVGQEDIVVGTPVANRPRPELEGMIGLFLNTLVLRTNMSGDPTFRELLRRIRKVCLGAYAHQELPFERLVEELQPERDLSRAPLFQVFFNLFDITETTLTLPGLTVSPLPGTHETTKFDFTLYVLLTGEGATVQWSYNSDLFDASTIAWMADQYQTVLMHLHATLDYPISRVSLLQEEDRARLMVPSDPVSPTQPFAAFPETAVAQSIPARFEDQVHQRPDQLAVHTPQYQWTYEEVNRRANQIAHTLLSRRFPADTRVALLCAHDAPMVAAILGVLKAGHAYVPLDPSFPPARLETIVADAGAQAVLAESTYLPLAHKLGEAAGQVFNMDEAFAQANTRNPQQVSPDALAYVLYTSGTTGVPKGVMQSHRHVLHHIRVYTNNLHLQAGDRLTLLASYGFDAAVMDLFGALLNGATLYPFNLREAEFTTLSAWIKQHAITVYHSAPTVYRYWIDALQEGPTLPALRLIVLGGEVATRADFEAYQQYFGPNCLFVNGLGPTESTVSLQFVADHTTKIIGQTVPVGFPVEHTEITLLSQDGKEAEVYGEIAIRSPYVAIGYWHQPELTQKAFDPPMEAGNARLYRTGDMGRRRYDGSLEFMGRKDTQVKIRGYRIELGEIEAVLRRQPAVREAVVLIRDEDVEDGQLVAYVSIEAGHSFDQAGLRESLQKLLPGYMVPSVFVGVEAFLLTPNGKIDRKALPAPEAADRTHGASYVAPRTVLEELLAEVWQEVLKIDRIGIHDNFFELGGHSLSAIRVIASLRDKLDLDIPLRSIFEYPVIAQLTLDIVAQLADIFPDSSGDGL